MALTSWSWHVKYQFRASQILGKDNTHLNHNLCVVFITNKLIICFKSLRFGTMTMPLFFSFLWRILERISVIETQHKILEDIYSQASLDTQLERAIPKACIAQRGCLQYIDIILVSGHFDIGLVFITQQFVKVYIIFISVR